MSARFSITIIMMLLSISLELPTTTSQKLTPLREMLADCGEGTCQVSYDSVLPYCPPVVLSNTATPDGFAAKPAQFCYQCPHYLQ